MDTTGAVVVGVYYHRRYSGDVVRLNDGKLYLHTTGDMGGNDVDEWESYPDEWPTGVGDHKVTQGSVEIYELPEGVTP